MIVSVRCWNVLRISGIVDRKLVRIRTLAGNVAGDAASEAA